MHIQKKLLLTIILMISCSTFLNFSLSGQNQEQYKIVNHGIYIFPGQLVFPEVMMTYEHFKNQKLSYSYSLAYKIPVGKGNYLEAFGHGLIAVYEYQYMFNEFSNGLYTSFAPAYYLDSRRKRYIQAETFYRFYWFSDKKLAFDNGENYNYNAIRSERIHIAGLKLLSGTNKILPISDNMAINIKLYGGLGFRYKNYTYESIDNEVKNYDDTTNVIPYEILKGDLLIPSIHIGFNIGIAKTIIIPLYENY